MLRRTPRNLLTRRHRNRTRLNNLMRLRNPMRRNPSRMRLPNPTRLNNLMRPRNPTRRNPSPCRDKAATHRKTVRCGNGSSNKRDWSTWI